MKYIVIDNFNGDINILTNEEGEVAQFDSAKQAQEYCNNEAQNGQVIPLNVNILSVLSNSDDIEGIYEILGDYNK